MSNPSQVTRVPLQQKPVAHNGQQDSDSVRSKKRPGGIWQPCSFNERARFKNLLLGSGHVESKSKSLKATLANTNRFCLGPVRLGGPGQIFNQPFKLNGHALSARARGKKQEARSKRVPPRRNAQAWPNAKYDMPHNRACCAVPPSRPPETN